MAQKRKKTKTKSKKSIGTGGILLWLIFGVLLIGIIIYFYFQFSGQQNLQYFQQLAQTYENHLVENQDVIVEAIESRGKDPQETAYLFIPNRPAEYIDMISIPQHNVPYLSQHDPRWAKEPYGTDASAQVWENGCAILSLAMVDQYFTGKYTRPQDIIAWSGNDYYLDNQGSTWTIYEDFGQAFGYEVINLGNDFHGAMSLLGQGYLVIVSVGPGWFTEGGHIMVIRGYDGYNVYLNDPNDSPDKFFSIQAIPAQRMVEDGINYWAFYPQ